jgi:hypothetical protein
MGIVIMIPNSGIEPLVQQLDNWIKWLRPGTLSAKVGAIKGALMPMAQGVYYDREALFDEHAVWETLTEGENTTTKRKVDEFRNDKGTKLGEQPVEVPFLMEEKWLVEQTTQLVKDQMGLAPVDFGMLRYIQPAFAKTRHSEQ